MKIQIEWAENKTSKSGVNYKSCSVTTEDGRKLDNVAVFGSFSQFADVAPGRSVEGIIAEKDYNGKTSYSIINGNLGKRPGGVPYPKSQMIEKAMEKKEESIEKFQDNKEMSIKTSSTMRDAVLLAIAEKGDSDVSAPALQSSVIRWRKWLWENWDKKDTDFDPF